MALTQDFALSTIARCNYLQVSDNSEYTSPTVREDYGIALFFEKDTGNGFSEDTNLHDLSNSGVTGNPGSWDIQRENEDAVYKLHAFHCPVYAAGSFSIGDIVYYEVSGTTGFWRNTTGVDSTPAVGSPNWTEMTTSNFTQFTAASLLNCSLFNEETTAYKCNSVEFILTSCPGTFEVISHESLTQNVTLYIYDLLGNILIDGLEVQKDGAVGTTSFTFDGDYSDGVYHVKALVSPVGSDSYQLNNYALYNTCRITACMSALVDELMCNDWDPCCSNCDNDAIEARKKQRLTLNELGALYGFAMAYIHADRINYLGVNGISADRFNELNRIQNLLDKLNDIIIRCDICRGALSTSTTSSYKPCNC